MSGKKLSLEDLPQLLALAEFSESTSAALADLVKFHEDCALLRLERLLNAFVRYAIDVDIWADYSSLSDKAKIRLATAPETLARLVAYSDIRPLFFRQSVVAERRLLELPTNTSIAVWTALGDFHFSQSDQNLRSSLKIRAPTVNGIPVDFRSPWVTSPHAEHFGEAGHLAASEGIVAVSRLEAAAAEIASERPSASTLISSFTRVIVLYVDRDSVGFGSCSEERYAGRTFLSNLLAPSATSTDIVSALVHESVHSLMYALQLREQLVVTDPLSVRVTSPWTGRALEVSSFYHACFVWFALWQYWSHSKRPPTPEVVKMSALARGGFDRPAMLDGVRAVSRFLAPRPREIINECVAAVRRGAFQ